MSKKKILFVCLGNICRSPMAEGICRTAAFGAGLNIEIDSAGTGGWHAGEAPDPRAIAICGEHGIDISKQKARQFKLSDFDDYDYIFAMDKSNYHDLVLMANTTAQAEKVNLIMNLSEPGKNKSVPDPYYGGEAGFEKVYQMITGSVNALVLKLKIAE